MTNNNQQPPQENPNNQFSNNEPMTFAQKVEYVKSTEKPKQQTAVEWLEQEMLKPNLSMKEILEQAKEMEKERIIDAHYEGQCNQTEGYPLQIAEQYYKQTYGGGEQ